MMIALTLALPTLEPDLQRDHDRIDDARQTQARAARTVTRAFVRAALTLRA